MEHDIGFDAAFYEKGEVMTPRQKEIYMVIDEYWKRFGYGPSIDDVMYITNAKGRGNIHRIMKRLVELGHCKALPDKARTVRPKGVRMQYES